jgi:hypothetical protein
MDKMIKVMMPGFFSVLLLAASASASEAPQAPPSASLDFASGQVQVVSKAGTSDGKHGQALLKGDWVKTGKGSAAILLMSDGSRVKLNPETSLEIASAENGQTELSLQTGAVFSKVQKQGPRGRFVIRTKTAVMGVRGTEFYTAYGKESKGGADVWMCVHEGKVETEGLSDGKKVLVKQGEGVFIPVGKAVTPPKKYSWTENLNWNMNPDAGEVIDHTRIDYQDLLKVDYD